MGGDQESDGHVDRAPEFLCGDGRTFQKDNHLCSTEATPQYKAHGSLLGVCQKAPKDSQTMRNKRKRNKRNSGLMKPILTSLA